MPSTFVKSSTYFYRDSGESAAKGAIADLSTVGVTERDDFSQTFWMEVGRLKAQGKISLADCFAITLTNRTGGTLLTSDHHEMDRIVAAGLCNIAFIRFSRDLLLRNRLQEVSRAYDYCVIDTAPNLDAPTINALALSDMTIIPVDSSHFALVGQVERKTLLMLDGAGAHRLAEQNALLELSRLPTQRS